MVVSRERVGRALSKVGSLLMMWMAVAAVYCAVGIAAGAFGAHGLRARLDPEELALWETGCRYLMYGGLGLGWCSVALRQIQAGQISLWLLAAGAAIFSTTLWTMALGGPRWLGAITPIGGAAMILGFLTFAYFAFGRVNAS